MMPYVYSQTTDSEPQCPRCRGSGFVTMPRDQWPPLVIQPQMPCPCAAEKNLIAGLDRIWTGLGRVAPAPASALHEVLYDDANVRGRPSTLAAHLSAALRADPAAMPGIELVTDGDLVDAAFDKDLRPSELYLPPRLLVLQLGSVGRHKMLPKLALQAVLRRQLAGKATWVVDVTGKVAAPGHPAWSDELGAAMADWAVVDLDPADHSAPPTASPSPEAIPAAISAAKAQDRGPDEVDGLDPKVAAVVGKKRWQHRPQGNGGTRICCQIHTDVDFELSVYEYKGAALYKCQTCGAKGSADKLAPAKLPA